MSQNLITPQGKSVLIEARKLQFFYMDIKHGILNEFYDYVTATLRSYDKTK